MGMIMRAAGFLTCNCGHRGWIVRSDGVRSIDIYSKYAAYKIVESAVAQGVVTEIELPELRRQISASKLPDDVGIEDLTTFIEAVADAKRNEEECPDQSDQTASTIN